MLSCKRAQFKKIGFLQPTNLNTGTQHRLIYFSIFEKMKVAVKNKSEVEFVDELICGSKLLSTYNYTHTNDPFYEPYTFYNILCNNENTYYVFDHSSGILTASLANTHVTYTPTVMPDGMKFTLNGVYDYYPYGKILREYVQGTQEKHLTTHHACPALSGERDAETGLD